MFWAAFDTNARHAPPFGKDLFDDFRQIVDVTLCIDPPREGKSNKIMLAGSHKLGAAKRPKHDAANLTTAHASMKVERDGKRLSWEFFWR